MHKLFAFDNCNLVTNPANDSKVKNTIFTFILTIFLWVDRHLFIYTLNVVYFLST